MPAIKFIITILFLIVVSSLAVKNMHPVQINYYDHKLAVQSIEVPVMVLIIAPLGLGFIIAWAGGIVTQLKLRSSIRKQKRALNAFQNELDELRPETHLSESTRIATED